MTLPPQLLPLAEKAHHILFLGGNDTGKTTLTAALARHFLQKSEKVAVIDADLGQSDIGPPTTIGLAILEKEFSSWNQVEPKSLYFIGSTSPVGHLLETVVGTYRLTQQAKALGVPRILVDTSGLIGGGVGWALKNYKIELLRPDLIVALERKTELSTILAPWQKRPGLTILRLAPPLGVRRRSGEERKLLREASFSRYFREKAPFTLNWQKVPFVQIPWGWGKPLGINSRRHITYILEEEILWAERGGDILFLATVLRAQPQKLRRLLGFEGSARLMNVGVQELPGSYLGLGDSCGETHVLGCLSRVDFHQRLLELEVPSNQATKTFSQIFLPKKLVQTL